VRLLFGIKSLSTVRGGAERVLTDISSELAMRGHEVIIVTFDNSLDEILYNLNNKIKIHKIEIGNTKKRTTFLDFFKRVIHLRRSVKEIKPDIVIGFMSSIYVLFSFALIGTKFPLISSEHTVPEYYKKRKIEFLLLIFSGLVSDKMTVLSDRIRQLYPKILHNRMIVIPNSVSIKKIQNIKSSNNIILSVGRLEPSKDHETLIKAFSILHKKYPHWTLRIIGDGPLKIQLAKIAEVYSITNKVFFSGSISNIEEEYSKASFFVLPSLYESFGLVTIEAMACELPVIGFKECPGTNELVIDKFNGLLVSSEKRIENLANAMERLIVDKTLLDSLKANTLETAQSFYIDKIILKWEYNLNQVLKDNLPS
jgi:glycosyltransferase involved in cell wall biosynthesis